MMKGYQAVRSASSNPEVQRQADSNLRDAQRNVSYLEESLQALINKRSSNTTAGSATSSSGQATPTSSFPGSSSFGGQPGSSQTSFSSGTSGSLPPGAQRGYPGDAASAYHRGGPGDRPLPPAPGSPGFPGGYGVQDPRGAGGSGQWQPAPINRMATSARRNFTNLDLIKHDTPITTARISRMLHQLEFKLQIERQYKQGIDKMAALYQAEGDRKSRNDAESKRVESSSKIMLLQQALKRYKQLHVMDEEEEDQREYRVVQNAQSVCQRGLIDAFFGSSPVTQPDQLLRAVAKIFASLFRVPCRFPFVAQRISSTHPTSGLVEALERQPSSSK